MMDVQACRFDTERLSVCEWAAFVAGAGNGEAVYERIARILSPEATQELPAGWQGVHTAREARAWLAQRLSESVVLAVQARLQGALIGFVFLAESPSPIERTMEVRLGYV